MKCCQDRIYIWPISTVFLRALGRGDIDQVVGKHSLEVSFYGVLPFFRNANILDADYGRSLFENPMYFPPAPWYPWGPTFHDTAFSTKFVETEPVILRLTSQLSLCTFSVFAVLNSIQRFHPTRIGVRLACCLLAYVPVKPNMFSVSEPNSIISLLSRLWIQEPTLALRARKNSTINFQEILGAWVRQCLVVSPSGMASHSSSSESQSLRLSWRVLILRKVRNGLFCRATLAIFATRVLYCLQRRQLPGCRRHWTMPQHKADLQYTFAVE